MRVINTPSINPVIKSVSREKWLKTMKQASESQSINKAIVAEKIDSKNNMLEQNTKVFTPILKSIATLKSHTNHGEEHDITEHTSIFDTSKTLSELFETYIKKLSEDVYEVKLKNILHEIQGAVSERDEMIKNYEELNDDTIESLIILKNSVSNTDDKIDELLVRLDEHNLDKQRLEDLREMHTCYKNSTDEIINSLKSENQSLIEKVPKTIKDYTLDELKVFIESIDDYDKVTFLRNNLPNIRNEATMSHNVYNNVYNKNRHMKASDSLRKDMPSVNAAIIQYKTDLLTETLDLTGTATESKPSDQPFGTHTGQGVCVSPNNKNLDLVNLLLASNRAGNTSGFKEFEGKLNKLLDKKMITKSDYETFLKSWRC